ncbi:MAG: amidohydrolase family protein, partial [Chloroflexi bacterium]|nr:amidohydrolase family protein [Chloroflexota bacterium]
VDLLVRHGHVLTMADDARVIPDGAVAIAGRRIVEVGEDAALAARYRASRTIDAEGAPVHPGLVDCHAHASFHIFRGAVPDHVSESEVFDAVERPYYDAVTDEEEYLGVVLAALEMIRSGTTAFLEAGTVLTPAAAAEAAQLVGIRAVLADARVMDRPRPERRIRRSPANLDEALARLGGELRRNADPDALVTGHVAVLGFGTASDELLIEAGRQATAAGAVLNMHHAYGEADTAADRARFGTDPLVHFAEIGILRRNLTLGHANHLTDRECDLLLQAGSSVAWAPAASMLWGHGGTIHGRHAELWRRGATIAFGADSGNWSNSFDLFRQASLALLTAREAHGDRLRLVAEDVLAMATRAGARAAGLEDRAGSLEVGKRADLVIHTLDRPELRPTTDLVRNLIYAAGSRTVRTVIVDGAVILENGAFNRLDEARLLAQVDAASGALFRRIGRPVAPNRVPARTS